MLLELWLAWLQSRSCEQLRMALQMSAGSSLAAAASKTCLKS